MAEILITDKEISGEEKYKLLLKQINNLLVKEDNLISNLANFTAVLKETFEKISWVGFYIFDGEKLYLGPFQGKIACTNITLSKGVCGTAAVERKTMIVPDVNKFPGHIVCDADSKSEIVIPIFKEEKLFGVLDLDSTDFNSFNEIDKKYLEKLVDFLSENIL